MVQSALPKPSFYDHILYVAGRYSLDIIAYAQPFIQVKPKQTNKSPAQYSMYVTPNNEVHIVDSELSQDAPEVPPDFLPVLSEYGLHSLTILLRPRL